MVENILFISFLCLNFFLFEHDKLGKNYLNILRDINNNEKFKREFPAYWFF